VVNVTPRPFYPRERPGTHCVGVWVVPMSGLNRCGKSRHHLDSLLVGRSGHRIPVEARFFRTRPDRPWGPPSLLYNGYLVFPELKSGRGFDNPPPSSAEIKERVELYLYTAPSSLRGLFQGELYLYLYCKLDGYQTIDGCSV
jgi:hypothetical protein